MVAREIKRVRNASVFRAATISPCQHQSGRDITCLIVLCCGLEPERESLDGECQQVSCLGGSEWLERSSAYA